MKRSSQPDCHTRGLWVTDWQLTSNPAHTDRQVTPAECGAAQQAVYRVPNHPG